jgi:hypothetical protein
VTDVRPLLALFHALCGRGLDAGEARRFVLHHAAVLLARDLAPRPPTGLPPTGLPPTGLPPTDLPPTGLPATGLLAPVSPPAPGLTGVERALLAEAAGADWSAASPALLGGLFQATLKEGARHEQGAHYTPEEAIRAHVVGPSLVDPWRARLRAAETREALVAVHAALAGLRVLDPACGSGNFLLVALRALRDLEGEIRARLGASHPPAVSAAQLAGIDADPLALELARVALALAGGPGEPDLRCADALFCDWPAADLILGNPPFQSKNKLGAALGAAYVERLRRQHPQVPGRADYCVYWFRRAHDALPPGGRAGLVGTNTIRENDSRRGGLDHVVATGGTITAAVSTMVWPGAAAVHVSVVNWIKGEQEGPRRLSWQTGDTPGSPWAEVALDRIPASLSPRPDVTTAQPLGAVVRAGACAQGQTHGHEGFLLSAAEARALCAADPRNAEVIFPYLTGADLLAARGGRPTRWIVDFHPRAEAEARRYALPFQRIEALVQPARARAAAAERARNEGLAALGNHHHRHFLRHYWLLGYPRGELVERLARIPRYIACSRVSKRPIFAFVASAIRPGDALAVFPLADDYSFGILQSGLHGAWALSRGSSLKRDRRYTSSTVFDSFPWPQAPSAEQVAAVAEAAVAVRAQRGEEGCLRALYAALERPGAHPLGAAHAALDAAVAAAYGLAPGQDPLAFLLDLNHACADREARGLSVVGPGLPPGVAGLVSDDAVQPLPL